MSREERTLKYNVNMFWKVYGFVNASVFCFIVNVLVKHNERLKQERDLL